MIFSLFTIAFIIFLKVQNNLQNNIFVFFQGIFSTYTETLKKLGNTNYIVIPLAVANELFSLEWGDILEKKIKNFEETRDKLDNLSKNQYKLGIGEIYINELSRITISLESYSSFEESFNSEQHFLPDIPVKITLKYSVPPSTEYIIPATFSRKKDRSGQNIELENLLTYTLVKLPATQYLKFIKSGEYSKFLKDISYV